MSALSKLSTLKQLGPVLTRQNILALQTNYVHRRAVFYLINHTGRYYPVRSFETSAQTDAQSHKPAAPGSSSNSTLPQQQQQQPKDPKEPSKEPLLKRIKHEINHYVNGTKLLGYEIKVSTKLLIKFAQGYELTRREHNQLKRTMGDVFRLVPFSAFVIIPFAELLLPVALKIFPNLLPSTYESGKDKHLKRMKLLEIRRKTSEIIHETLEESSLLSYNSIESAEKKKAFLKFFQKVYTARQMAASKTDTSEGSLATTTNNNTTTDDKIITFTHSEIQNIAKMFKNDTVLDNLSRSQLIAMAKFMSLRPFGTDNMLRQQIRFLLKGIMNDDKVIFYEGLDALSQEELYQACVSRGMKSYGLTTEELKDNMKIWLQLRLKDRIPSVLMILSSTVTYGGLEDSSKWMQDLHMRVVGNGNSEGNNQYERMLDLYYNGILYVLSTIPDPVYNIAKLDVSASAPESSTPSSSSKVEAEATTESVKALEAEVAPQTVVSAAAAATVVAAPATVKAKVDSVGTTKVEPGVTDSRVQQTPTTTKQPVEQASQKEMEVEETAVTEKEKEGEGEEEEEAALEESKIDENAFKLKALKEQEELIKKEQEEEAMRTKLAEMPVSDIISLDKDDTPTVLAKAEAEAEAALRAAEEEQERAKQQATEAVPKDKREPKKTEE